MLQALVSAGFGEWEAVRGVGGRDVGGTWKREVRNFLPPVLSSISESGHG